MQRNLYRSVAAGVLLALVALLATAGVAQADARSAGIWLVNDGAQGDYRYDLCLDTRASGAAQVLVLNPCDRTARTQAWIVGSDSLRNAATGLCAGDSGPESYTIALTTCGGAETVWHTSAGPLHHFVRVEDTARGSVGLTFRATADVRGETPYTTQLTSSYGSGWVFPTRSTWKEFDPSATPTPGSSPKPGAEGQGCVRACTDS